MTDDDRREGQPAFPWLRTNPGLTNMAPSDLPVAPAPAPAPVPRRSRARVSPAWWILLPSVLVLACLGGVTLNAYDNARRSGRNPPVAIPQASVSPVLERESPPVPQDVVYLVTSTGKGEKASVEYTDEDFDIIRKGEVSLPWRYAFRTDGTKPPLVVLAQRRKGGTGPVTCTITVDGKLLTTTVQDGRSASVMCSA